MKLIRSELGRQTPFSFACACCLRCCHHKSIQLNPYETARLAANRGISTTEFISRFTTANGTSLGWTDTGACVFLDDKGCSVHPDRPLVCRLYPLGRHVNASGIESFSELERESGCEGANGTASAIDEYLDEQGAGPYIRAADRYLELLWALAALVREQAEDPQQRRRMQRTARTFRGYAVQRESSLMDMDATVGRYCEEQGEAFPEGLEERMTLHIKAVEDWIRKVKTGGHHEKVETAEAGERASGEQGRT